jgi:hypothetical protein
MNETPGVAERAEDLRDLAMAQLLELREQFITDEWTDSLEGIADADRRAAALEALAVQRCIRQFRKRRLHELESRLLAGEQELLEAQQKVKETGADLRATAGKIKAIGQFVEVVGRVVGVAISFA